MSWFCANGFFFCHSTTPAPSEPHAARQVGAAHSGGTYARALREGEGIKPSDGSGLPKPDWGPNRECVRAASRREAIPWAEVNAACLASNKIHHVTSCRNTPSPTLSPGTWRTVASGGTGCSYPSSRLLLFRLRHDTKSPTSCTLPWAGPPAAAGPCPAPASPATTSGWPLAAASPVTASVGPEGARGQWAAAMPPGAAGGSRASLPVEAAAASRPKMAPAPRDHRERWAA